MAAMSFWLFCFDTTREEGHAMMERVRQNPDMKWENDLVVTISGGLIEVDMLNTPVC